MGLCAQRRLMTELKELNNNAPDGIIAGPVSEDNILVWDALVQGPTDTPFENGIFVARLNFPSDYPLNPPTMRFISPIVHPNMYKDGRVCISILHHPGEDPMMYESSSERWSPVQSVEKILMSVLSMIAEPNVESSADIDVGKMYRDNYEKFAELAHQSSAQSYEQAVNHPLYSKLKKHANVF